MQYSSFVNSRRSVENYSDPSLPNYRPPWWRRSVEHWQKTLDWCGFLDDPDFKNRYLCEVAGEFQEDRLSRIMAEDPEPYFKDAVNDHASIFTQFEIAKDAPESLIQNQANVNLEGAGLWQWSAEPFRALFRDGGVLVGADIDRQVVQGQRRPRLIWVPLRDVYWVEYRSFGEAAVFARCSIRKTVNTLNDDGKLQLRSQFWVYELDDQRRCTLTLWREDDNAKLIQGESVALVDASNRPLDRLPLSDKLTFIGDLNMDAERLIMSPFSDVLSLNIKHYNQSSELSAIRRKTACPTPIRYWANGVPDPVPPFYAGSGKTQDYAAGSSVEYLELNGQSIPELRVGVEETERKIKERDNKLFHTKGGMSATEADIENQKAKVGMPLIKAAIESAYQDVFTIWERLANPRPAEGIGSIIIDDTALDAPPNPADIIPFMQAIDRGIDTNVIIAAMVRRGLLTQEDFDQAARMTPASTALPIDPNEVIL